MIVPAQTVEEYIAWRRSPAALTLVLRCGHSRYIRWGTYQRKTCPCKVAVFIQRLFCLVCRHTYSVLPAFLLGQVHYTTHTVGLYVDYIAAKPVSIVTAWIETPNTRGFPRSLYTLYRWFKRLRFRLAIVLTLLEKELLELTPQTSPESLQKLIVKKAAIRQHLASSPFSDATNSNAFALTLHALCQSNLRLAKQLLHTTDKLLSTSQRKKLPPLVFLNFFCWQKTGEAILLPLPQKPHPPPA